MNIGLDNVYYAVITENSSGEESYGTPKKLSPAVSANIQINRTNTDFHADDDLNEIFDDFVDGNLSLNVKDLLAEALKDIFGAHQDSKGQVVESSEDLPVPVAILFRSMIRAGVYAYFTLYRVQFKPANSTYNTKSNSITINTPTIEGRIMRRHKLNALGDHPWRLGIREDDPTADATTISNWFSAVPEYYVAPAQSGQT